MAESFGGQVKYIGQPEPVLRTRDEKEAWLRVQRDNHLMQHKLEEIRREPPSNFHAPNGYASLYGGNLHKAQFQGKASSPQTGTTHYVPPTAWPPKGANHVAAPRKEAQRLVDIENERIAKKLQTIYTKRDDPISRNKLGVALDCNDRWQLRTDFYRPQSAPSTTATGATSALEHHQPGRKVPKSQGAAICSGCAAKGFYHADGVSLFPCRKCKQVFYCSETCASVDWTSHKQMCAYATTGAWTGSGKRPPNDYWVNNRAMGEARRALEHLPRGSTPAEEVERASRVQAVYEKARAQELAAEKLQAEIERRADQGLDGPRPCMCSNGKKI